MSELTHRYISLMARAAELKERFRKNNDGDIEKSTSFLAEDYKECVRQIDALSAELYKEHYAKRRFDYIDSTLLPRRGRWKQNPRLQKRESNNQPTLERIIH